MGQESHLVTQQEFLPMNPDFCICKARAVTFAPIFKHMHLYLSLTCFHTRTCVFTMWNSHAFSFLQNKPNHCNGVCTMYNVLLLWCSLKNAFVPANPLLASPNPWNLFLRHIGPQSHQPRMITTFSSLSIFTSWVTKSCSLCGSIVKNNTLLSRENWPSLNIYLEERLW